MTRKLKVLNLYAGIGGNRKEWYDVDVTAVESDPDIADVYKKNFPNDTVIIGDAHQYLIDHYTEFDFIWSSPPCPTHGQLRYRTCVLSGRSKPVYPDMKLYEEIIFLKHHFEGIWVVENVDSYYKPLIQPYIIGRHYVWSNVIIAPFHAKHINPVRSTADELEKEYGINTHGMKNRRLALRNCVLPEMGLHIFKCVIGKVNQKKLL